MAGSGDHCVHKITANETGGIFQLYFEVFTYKWQVIIMIMLIDCLILCVTVWTHCGSLDLIPFQVMGFVVYKVAVGQVFS
jgi:hypothetical protein